MEIITFFPPGWRLLGVFVHDSTTKHSAGLVERLSYTVKKDRKGRKGSAKYAKERNERK